VTDYLTMQEWIKYIKLQKDGLDKKREHLLYDVAAFVTKMAKLNAKQTFGLGVSDRKRINDIGLSARTSGRSGALMRSIHPERIGPQEIIVMAGGPGVPYAATHEYGTIGKGGTMPTIFPKKKFLTIPMWDKYVGKRATQFNLRFEMIRGTDKGMLIENFGTKPKMAYLLLRKVDIKPRPYLKPAGDAAKAEEMLVSRVKTLFFGGDWQIPIEVTRT